MGLPIETPGALANSSEHPDRWERLTLRQKEIARLVSERKSNKLVASTLGLHEQTVKNHLFVIFSKLGIRSRRELWDGD